MQGAFWQSPNKAFERSPGKARNVNLTTSIYKVLCYNSFPFFLPNVSPYTGDYSDTGVKYTSQRATGDASWLNHKTSFELMFFGLPLVGNDANDVTANVNKLAELRSEMPNLRRLIFNPGGGLPTYEAITGIDFTGLLNFSFPGNPTNHPLLTGISIPFSNVNGAPYIHVDGAYGPPVDSRALFWHDIGGNNAHRIIGTAVNEFVIAPTAFTPNLDARRQWARNLYFV
jgi:hypothetical protein